MNLLERCNSTIWLATANLWSPQIKHFDLLTLITKAQVKNFLRMVILRKLDDNGCPLTIVNINKKIQKQYQFPLCCNFIVYFCNIAMQENQFFFIRIEIPSWPERWQDFQFLENVWGVHIEPFRHVYEHQGMLKCSCVGSWKSEIE
jgi:hypothetical protein